MAQHQNASTAIAAAQAVRATAATLTSAVRSAASTPHNPALTAKRVAQAQAQVNACIQQLQALQAALPAIGKPTAAQAAACANIVV